MYFVKRLAWCSQFFTSKCAQWNIKFKKQMLDQQSHSMQNGICDHLNWDSLGFALIM